MADRKNTQTEKIYQLKIRLEGSKPPIWRRVQLKGSMSLYKLHQIIQICMGWEDEHLHQFIINNSFYGQSEFNPDILSENRYKVGQLLSEKNTFHYKYDFGDGWMHKIRVEKVLEPEADAQYPRCLSGKLACPPEDCGGIWGYQALKDALTDKNHPEHAYYVNWLQEVFDLKTWDTESFDLEQVNRYLKAIR